MNKSDLNILLQNVFLDGKGMIKIIDPTPKSQVVESIKSTAKGIKKASKYTIGTISSIANYVTGASTESASIEAKNEVKSNSLFVEKMPISGNP